MKPNVEKAFRLLRALYNEDIMWIEMSHARRGYYDKRIHRILCSSGINHQCEKGQHFKLFQKRKP